MREFSAEYLRETREGMWEDSRDALADLDLPSRTRVLDVGCGTGTLTGILSEETGGLVVGVDADRSHVRSTDGVAACGDAYRLPFPDGTFDLVVAQALLVNLTEPVRAVQEFARVSSDLVSVIEPDNGRVQVDSTAPSETRLAQQARQAYIEGVATDVTLGADARTLFDSAGLTEVTVREYSHRQTIEPPYSEDALQGAVRKANGERLAEARPIMLNGQMTADEYDELRDAWRDMGRIAVKQMRAGDYERAEVVPFCVTTGRV